MDQPFDAPPTGGTPPLSEPLAMPTGGEEINVTWRGSPWSLTGLSFLNFFLTIITLGIYSFWAKTEVRKRIWSSVRLNEEPLVYTGTGKELFLGFLIIFGVLIAPIFIAVFASTILLGELHPVTIGLQVIIYPVAFVLFGVAIYRARRYRLSRTTWRGIRGTLVGSPWRYAWTYIWTTILIPFTLGWIIPYRAHALNKRMTNDQMFGSELTHYDGNAGSIYARFATVYVIGSIAMPVIAYLAWRLGVLDVSAVGVSEPDVGGMRLREGSIIVLVLVAILIYSVLQAWYYAGLYNYFARNTTYASSRFNLNITVLGLIGVVISNFLIIIFSLTILQPVAMARASRYFVDNFSIDGRVDVEAIAQNQEAMSKTGEGLAEAFDVDAF